jgi:hypothetical protein
MPTKDLQGHPSLCACVCILYESSHFLLAYDHNDSLIVYNKQTNRRHFFVKQATLPLQIDVLLQLLLFFSFPVVVVVVVVLSL